MWRRKQRARDRSQTLKPKAGCLRRMITWSLWGVGLLFGCGIIGTLVAQPDGVDKSRMGLVAQMTVTPMAATTTDIVATAPLIGEPTATKAAVVAQALKLVEPASTVASSMMAEVATNTQTVTATPTASKTTISTMTNTSVQTATLLATITRTPIPTATNRATPTITNPAPTATDKVIPTLTNSPTATRVAGTVAKQNANLRGGPGTDYGVLGTVTGGETLLIVGQNQDGSWYQLSSRAWIAAFLVEGATGGYAVIASEPTAAPTVAPTVGVEATAIPPVTAPVAAPSSGSDDTPFVCNGGCAEPPPGSTCVIKGNVNSNHEKIYHVPGGQSYEKTDIKPEEGDRWFCTPEEAIATGFRASKR